MTIYFNCIPTKTIPLFSQWFEFDLPLVINDLDLGVVRVVEVRRALALAVPRRERPVEPLRPAALFLVLGRAVLGRRHVREGPLVGQERGLRVVEAPFCAQ